MLAICCHLSRPGRAPEGHPTDKRRRGSGADNGRHTSDAILTDVRVCGWELGYGGVAEGVGGRVCVVLRSGWSGTWESGVLRISLQVGCLPCAF